MSQAAPAGGRSRRWIRPGGVAQSSAQGRYHQFQVQPIQPAMAAPPACAEKSGCISYWVISGCEPSLVFIWAYHGVLKMRNVCLNRRADTHLLTKLAIACAFTSAIGWTFD